MANGTGTNRASRDEPPPSSPTGAPDVDDKGEEEEIGIFGRHGLLATPHVKTLLTLGCVVQVRARMHKPISAHQPTAPPAAIVDKQHLRQARCLVQTHRW